MRQGTARCQPRARRHGRLRGRIQSEFVAVGDELVPLERKAWVCAVEQGEAGLGHSSRTSVRTYFG